MKKESGLNGQQKMGATTFSKTTISLTTFSVTVLRITTSSIAAYVMVIQFISDFNARITITIYGFVIQL
jgi:hypothetical protein